MSGVCVFYFIKHPTTKADLVSGGKKINEPVDVQQFTSYEHITLFTNLCYGVEKLDDKGTTEFNFRNSGENVRDNCMYRKFAVEGNGTVVFTAQILLGTFPSWKYGEISSKNQNTLNID